MANGYRVTGQRQTTAMGQDGRFVDMMEVSFQVDDIGVIGSVDVPLFEYSADRVAELIGDRVTAIRAVHSL